MKLIDKIKNLIFEESDEMDRQDTQMLQRIKPSDSLEQNSNLRKAQMTPNMAAKDIKPIDLSLRQTAQQETFTTSQSVTGNVALQKTNSGFVSFDLNKTPNFTQPSTTPTATKKVTPIASVTTNHFDNTNVNPQYYKPKEVISPIFGIQNKHEVPSNINSMTSFASKETDKTLSPMYGEMTAQNQLRQNSNSRRTKKNNVSTMTLEDMLNIEDNRSSLDYTLFDVELDKSEFVSRENKIVFDDENQDK